MLIIFCFVLPSTCTVNERCGKKLIFAWLRCYRRNVENGDKISLPFCTDFRYAQPLRLEISSFRFCVRILNFRARLEMLKLALSTRNFELFARESYLISGTFLSIFSTRRPVTVKMSVNFARIYKILIIYAPKRDSGFAISTLPNIIKFGIKDAFAPEPEINFINDKLPRGYAPSAFLKLEWLMYFLWVKTNDLFWGLLTPVSVEKMRIRDQRKKKSPFRGLGVDSASYPEVVKVMVMVMELADIGLHFIRAIFHYTIIPFDFRWHLMDPRCPMWRWKWGISFF